MKKLIKISLLTLAFAASAWAGPSDGGGTNIVISENELADFVKFRAEHGDITTLINPKKFARTRGGAPVFDVIKPKLDRINRLYPGLGSTLEKAFGNSWVVVNAKLTSRNGAEKMVISQSDAGIYVNRAWLKTEHPELVQKAFLHEGVRSLARSLIQQYGGKPNLKLEDEITEELTPVIYNELPPAALEASLKKIGRRISKEYFYIADTVDFPSRAQLYENLTSVKGEKSLREFCEKVKAAKTDTDVRSAQFAARKNWSVPDNRRSDVNMMGTRHNIDLVRFYDQGAEDTARLIYYAFTVPTDYASRKRYIGLCESGHYEKFLREYEADQGKAGNLEEGADYLDDGETGAGETSAN